MRRQVAIKITGVAKADKLRSDFRGRDIYIVIFHQRNRWLPVDAQHGIFAIDLYADGRAFGENDRELVENSWRDDFWGWGPNRDGKSPETGLLQTWPAQGPPLAWRAKGAGIGYSSFAASGGRLYTLGGRGDREYVVAFDAATGEVKWCYDDVTGGPSYGSPILAELAAGRGVGVLRHFVERW